MSSPAASADIRIGDRAVAVPGLSARTLTTVAFGTLLAALALEGQGGLQLGPLTTVEIVVEVLAGVAAAAAGLIGAIVIKMARPLLREGVPGLVVAAAGFAAVGLMRWPLPYVLLVLAPVSIALAAWMRR